MRSSSGEAVPGRSRLLLTGYEDALSWAADGVTGIACETDQIAGFA
jgi:hypothetical protein